MTEELEKLHDKLEQIAKEIIEKFPKEADGLGTYIDDMNWQVRIRKVTGKL